ncbi:unnamed protein product [Porites evermanni]|uniref:Neurotrophin-3 n=1 Tax=Porites evermanni TaxID=104178 RepID=A0ABN8MF51_9CNID|nr:unnamed protein product [Porites evermanni]
MLQTRGQATNDQKIMLKQPFDSSFTADFKSRETPTMNALASIVQSVVEEMKAMNRRMDHLSKPINLEDKEIDYEEGELEHGDADRELVVSLDKKNLDLSEKTGSTVDEELANIVNSLFKDLTPDKKTQAKVDQYPRPVNFEGLRAPQVNPLIWSQLPAQVRTQ